jgi:hypothetical protein
MHQRMLEASLQLWGQQQQQERQQGLWRDTLST